jgi:hypothetical protein
LKNDRAVADVARQFAAVLGDYSPIDADVPNSDKFRASFNDRDYDRHTQTPFWHADRPWG